MSETTTETLAPSTRVIYATFDYARDHRALILAVLAAVVVIAVLVTGIYVVKKEEQGVLTRFGKVVDEEIPPGIHYAFPVIEKAHVRPVRRIMRGNVATQGGDGSVTFSILSGDTNLFEVNVALQYKIDHLRNYLYETTDPDTVMRVIVRERLIEIMGRHFIDLILTNNRDAIQAELHRDTLDYLDANDIGIELLALNIVDLRPIDETVAAFRDVSDAIAESVQAVSHANRERERLLARSRGQAEAVLMDATAKARERRIQAKSSAGAFLALLAAYRSEPASVTVTRYWQRMRSIFRDATLSAVNPGDTSVIDVNMIEGIHPGIGRGPAPTMAAPAPGATLAGAQTSITTASESGAHGLEAVEADRFLYDGRLHTRLSERDHMTIANPRSLIFDDLSIFDHRHAPLTSVAAAAEASEPPMVDRTVVDEGAEGGSAQDVSKTGTEEKKKKADAEAQAETGVEAAQ